MVQMITMEELNALRQEILENLNELKLIVSGAGKPAPEKRWLKSAEVRRILQISHGTLQKLRDQDKLPYTKINNVILYDMVAIERLLSSQK